MAARTSVGIDVGTECTKVVLGPSCSCEIVRTESGGHTTPTAVSFASDSNVRNIGETASRKGKHAIIHLNRLLLLSSSSSSSSSGNEEELKNDPMKPFYMFETTSENAVTVPYKGTNNTDNDDSSTTFVPSQLIAMLLGKIVSNVEATMNRLQTTTSNNCSAQDCQYVLSVPAGTNDIVKASLLDATYAAGIDLATIEETSKCYGMAYLRKFPELKNENKIVVIVDMGHLQTTVSVLRTGTNEMEVDGDDNDDDEKKENSTPNQDFEILASQSNLTLGAGTMDIRLWYHFQSAIPALKDVTPNSRSGQRLLDSCQKLKHLLSQLPEGTVTVENINDQDLKLTATRSLLGELCQTEAIALKALIEATLKEANVGVPTTESSTVTDDIHSVEVLGGGCRIPWVKDLIVETIKTATSPATANLSLSYSLDDTSAALGAALLCELDGNEITKLEPTEQQVQLRQLEQSFMAMDRDMKDKDNIRNKMEALVLELRSAKHGKHGSLLPGDELTTYLDELDNWLFSDECLNASKDDMQTKLQSTLDKTQELCKEYYNAIQKEQQAKDLEMEEEAKKAQLERNGEEQDEEDHDNRKLPKKRRMEIVMKNKAEANELFADGNYKFAAARYTKALTHCAKFVDLSPDDIAEVNSVKLSLNLNLALAYTKLSNPDQALRVVNEALTIDANSTKALYRRASIYYEKRKFSEANADAKKAASLQPNDKSIQKLQEKITVMLKKQKDKEKKMAQKMFS